MCFGFVISCVQACSGVVCRLRHRPDTAPTPPAERRERRKALAGWGATLTRSRTHRAQLDTAADDAHTATGLAQRS